MRMRPKKGQKWIQGIFTPLNPKKYVGDARYIIYRSSWELLCMSKFDNDPNVVSWASEEIVVPYLCPVRGDVHRYYPDFLVKMKDGTITMLEIKPESQQKVPRKGRKSQKTFINEAQTYMVNRAKWEYAKEFCRKKGWQFVVMNERDLGIKPKPRS
jgi:hypothetical protein